MWFLVAYSLTGQIVAVSTPYIGGPPHLRTEEMCEDLKEALLSPDRWGGQFTKYTYQCVHSRKVPKITGKMDHDLQRAVQDTCFNYGTACRRSK